MALCPGREPELGLCNLVVPYIAVGNDIVRQPSEYKTLSCELQDLRRGERYSASRIGECLEENDAVISFSGYYAA